MKVLLVVDDWEALDRYESELGPGFHVIPVFFGKDGIDAARAEHPEAILIDLVLEEMDGSILERSFRAEPGFDAVRIALVADSGVASSHPQTRVFRRPFRYEDVVRFLSSASV